MQALQAIPAELLPNTAAIGITCRASMVEQGGCDRSQCQGRNPRFPLADGLLGNGARTFLSGAVRDVNPAQLYAAANKNFRAPENMSRAPMSEGNLRAVDYELSV